jgi:hemerythrin
MAKSESRSRETIYDQEQKQLRDAIQQLRTRVDTAHQRATAAIEAFDQLHTAMQDHFQAEERSGAFFDEIVTQAPRLSGQADKLRGEHTAMLKLIDELEHDLKLEELVPWANIDEQLNELTQTLSRHEAAERDLMQTAYNEDIGAED